MTTSDDINVMKVGISFPDEESAVKSVLSWGEKNLCPLAKSRRDKSYAETNGLRRGTRYLTCPHGRSRKAGENEIRTSLESNKLQL